MVFELHRGGVLQEVSPISKGCHCQQCGDAHWTLLVQDTPCGHVRPRKNLTPSTLPRFHYENSPNETCVTSLRVKTGVQITVDKDMMSAAVKLAVEIEESSWISTGMDFFYALLNWTEFGLHFLPLRNTRCEALRCARLREQGRT